MTILPCVYEMKTKCFLTVDWFLGQGISIRLPKLALISILSILAILINDNLS